jgi:hypothetical protein
MTSEKSAPNVAGATSGRSTEAIVERTHVIAPVPAPPTTPALAQSAADDVPDDTTARRLDSGEKALDPRPIADVQPTVSAPAAAAQSPQGAPAASAAPVEDQGAGVKAGAVKAAAAALAAAKSAAKKVQVAATAPSSGEPTPQPARPTAQQATGSGTGAHPRAQMHYESGGVHGIAAPWGEAPAATGATNAVPPDAGPRRVRLSVSRIDPWSIMKLAFLLAVAIAVMTVVATAVVWYVLNDLGVFATIQAFVRETVGAEATVNIIQFVEFERMISLATLISLINIVLMTALATIMAILYNITAALVGGIHLTLTDE